MSSADFAYVSVYIWKTYNMQYIEKTADRKKYNSDSSRKSASEQARDHDQTTTNTFEQVYV